MVNGYQVYVGDVLVMYKDAFTSANFFGSVLVFHITLNENPPYTLEVSSPTFIDSTYDFSVDNDFDLKLTLQLLVLLTFDPSGIKNVPLDEVLFRL